MEVEINYLAVFLAGVSSMVVGSIWYMPNVFGKQWGKLAGVDLGKKMKASDMTSLLGVTFLISLVTAYVLAHVTFLSNNFFGNSWMQDALSTGFWMWLGFIAVRFMTHDMFEGRRKKLTLINIGNELATIMLMAFVIGLFKP